VIAASDLLGKVWLLWGGLALFVLAAIGGVIWINTGNRLKK
jgi:hypothetical protein